MEIEKKCSFSFFGNGKIFGVRRRGDLYYFDLVLFFFFFLRILSWVFFLLVLNRIC